VQNVAKLMITDSATTERTPPGPKRSDDMNEKDDEIAHLSILARPLLKQMPWAMASGQLHPGEHSCFERVHSCVRALGVIKDGANPLTGTSDGSSVEHDKCQIVCAFAKWLVFGDRLLASERLFTR